MQATLKRVNINLDKLIPFIHVGRNPTKAGFIEATKRLEVTQSDPVLHTHFHTHMYAGRTRRPDEGHLARQA
jgi:hypothetical protein